MGGSIEGTGALVAGGLVMRGGSSNGTSGGG